jgi:hypothetical protein
MRWVTTGGITNYLNSVGVSRWLPTLSLMLLFHAPGVPAREVTLAWDANTEPILGGYRLYYGLAHRNYTSVIDVGNQTTFTVHGLADDIMYCFAVTAYDTTKTIESAFSNEVAVMPTTLLVIDGGSSVGSSDHNVVLATDWVCG